MKSADTTNRRLRKPIVLLGSEFWSPIVETLRSQLLGQETIAAKDLAMLKVTDDPEEAVAHVKAVAMRHFGLTHRAKRRWFLGE